MGETGSELRDGYAEVGDQRLHYVETGEGPLVILLHGFPEFWYGWRLQLEPLAAAGFRVVAPDLRGYNLSSKPDGVAAYASDQLVADIRGLIRERGAESAHLVGHLGRNRRLGPGDEPPGGLDRLAILNAAHPNLPDLPRASSAIVVLLLAPADARAACTPRWRLSAFARRGSRDDQIPVFGRQQKKRSGASPGQCAHPGHLGGARPLPEPGTGRARPRRRAQPGPRRAAARRFALGPSRRRRAG